MSVAPFPRGVPVASGEYRINEFTRTYDDKCEVAQHDRDSWGPGKYQVTNLVPKQSAASSIEYVNNHIVYEGKEYKVEFIEIPFYVCIFCRNIIYSA